MSKERMMEVAKASKVDVKVVVKMVKLYKKKVEMFREMDENWSVLSRILLNRTNH